MKYECVICGIRSEEIAKQYKISVKDAEKVYEMHHISAPAFTEKKVLLCANCHTLVTLSENFRKKHQRIMENNVSEIIHWRMELSCLKCGKILKTVHHRKINGNPRVICPFCDSTEIDIRRIKDELET